MKASDCPTTLKEYEDLEDRLPLCCVQVYEQAEARINSGEAKSKREAARMLAEELDIKENTVRTALLRGQKKSGFTESTDPSARNLNNIEALLKVLRRAKRLAEKIDIDKPTAHTINGNILMCINHLEKIKGGAK